VDSSQLITAGKEYALYRLSNGLRVVTVELPGLHVAEIVCYLGVGSRYEKDQEAGVTHFLEHMLFRGTQEWGTSRELEEAFERIGGAVNASTDAESTCFFSRIHPHHLEQGIALFASMLRRPLFKDMDIERKIILEEAREDLNEKGDCICVDQLMAQLLWSEHPMGRPIIGTPESINQTDLSTLTSYFNHYYVPENMVLAVVGQIDSRKILTAVDTVFGDWQGNPKVNTCSVVTSDLWKKTEVSTWVYDSDSQISVQIAFALPGRYHETAVLWRVLARVLSGSGSSRLMLRLREELGLTYSVEAGLSVFDDTGSFVIDMAVTVENLERAVSETLDILAILRRDLIPEEELERVIAGYLFDIEFSRDHAGDMAARYGWGCMADNLRTLEEDKEELLRVTSGQIRDAVQEWLHPARIKLVAVGPFDKKLKERVQRLLARGAS